jgi:alkylhydroperoxidase/carboxymuconolactone decarboxylase family protein YurZ
MKVRRAVLGDAHADVSLKNRDEFNEVFQDLLTRYAWGEVWSRPGLPRQTCSMITLAMMVALNRTDELRMHMRGALNNGVPTRKSARFFCKRLFIAVYPQPTRPFISHRNYLHSKTSDPPGADPSSAYFHFS